MIEIDSRCIGCGACKNKCPVNCISIKRIDGQYTPVIDNSKCINCNQCEAVCVALHADKLDFHSPLTSFWGYANEETERIASSSGGIFFAIAKEFLKNGVVVGAAYDQSFTVRHSIVRSIDDLPRIRGSKYVESDLQGVFEDVKNMLDHDIRVLFSGVPCQIGAIKAFLGKSYDNLYTCEVFCHGVPRSGLFEEYISWLEKKIGKVMSFNFRSKHFGWKNPSYEIKGKRGCIIEQHKDNIYHLMFGKHVSLRDSCYKCQFRKYERTADLSLGDFWGIEKYYPNIYTASGISAIIVNTEKGKSMSQSAFIHLEQCDINEIYEKNIWMVRDYEKPIEQIAFINDYKSMNQEAFFRKYKFKYKVVDRVLRMIRRIIK